MKTLDILSMIGAMVLATTPLVVAGAASAKTSDAATVTAPASTTLLAHSVAKTPVARIATAH